MNDEPDKQTIENTARAIHAKQTELNGWLPTPWDSLDELQQRMWKQTALAAWRAIRRPEAGNAVGGEGR